MTIEGTEKKSIRVAGRDLHKNTITPLFLANDEVASIVATPRNKDCYRQNRVDSPIETKKSGMSPPNRSGT
jgi:hypothetical protein